VPAHPRNAAARSGELNATLLVFAEAERSLYGRSFWRAREPCRPFCFWSWTHAPAQKKFDDLNVFGPRFRGGEDQGGVAIVVPSVDVGSSIKKHLHCIESGIATAFRRDEQRCVARASMRALLSRRSCMFSTRPQPAAAIRAVWPSLSLASI
jgi:hypothetical protein